MSCPRCHGLIVYDGDEARCINCGWRKSEEEREKPMADVTSCTKCSAPHAEGRTLCQKHLDYQKIYNGNYWAKKAAGGHPVTPRARPVVITPNPAPSCTTVVQADRAPVVLSPAGLGLRAAVEALDVKIDELTEMKRQLIRASEVLSA